MLLAYYKIKKSNFGIMENGHHSENVGGSRFKNKKMLYAVLNWGLGHATRSIPLIQQLIDHKNEVTLASDGLALKLLQNHFPGLPYITLPAYNVHYRYESMILNMLLQSGKLFQAVKQENMVLKKQYEENKFDIIISDNRFGCHHEACHNIFLTHQIQLLHPKAAYRYLGSKYNQRLIRKFNECWVPDYEGNNNLSGGMSNAKNLGLPVQFIGPLSRFDKIEVHKNPSYRTISILSGPEPQRSIFEQALTTILQNIDGNHAIIRGIDTPPMQKSNITWYGLLGEKEISSLISKSKNIISRSGYSSIMDYEAMGLNAILVPTPGQFEQILLAKRMHALNRHQFLFQKDLSKQALESLLK